MAVKVYSEPVVQDAGYSRNGGIQSLSWFARTLRWNSEGDVAHEFLTAEDDPSSCCGGYDDSNSNAASGIGSLGACTDRLEAPTHRKGGAASALKVKVVGVQEGRIVLKNR